MDIRALCRSYLRGLTEVLLRGDAREESCYGTLERFLAAYAQAAGLEGIHVTVLPKPTEAGNPDFRVWDGRQHIVGYIEAKAPTAENLEPVAASEQLKRYRGTFPNLILTNFFEFWLYRNGERVAKARLGRPFVATRLRSQPPLEQVEELAELLELFFSFSLPKAYTAESLAVELAKRTRFLRDQVVLQELAQERERGGGHLLGFYEAFQKHLIAGLTLEDFADLYAQTITYGLFAARVRAQNNFNRREAFYSIPHTIGILRDLFRFISLEDLPAQLEWIVDDIAEVLAVADVKGILHQFFHEGKGADPIVHFYETFLSVYDPEERERRGVYYTPEPVVSYIVRSLHQILKDPEVGFGKPDGLAAEFGLAKSGWHNYLKAFPGPVVYTVGKSKTTDWPYLHPSKNDRWAGGRPHTFTIRFLLVEPPRGKMFLVVGVADAHPNEPSVITFSVNGATFATRKAPRGTGQAVRDTSLWVRPRAIVVAIPEGALHTGWNTLAIRLEGGSWIIYDYVRLTAEPKPPTLKPPTAEDLLAKALAGPLRDHEEIIFAVRQPGRDGHWYANFGTNVVDPARRYYYDGGRLSVLDVASGEVTDLIDDPAGGVFFSQNVYEGVPPQLRGRARYLRVLSIEHKTYTYWYKRPYLSTGPVVSGLQSDGVKRGLGTAPIEADGSVHFRAPSGVPLHFQLLDGRRRALQTMRSFTGLMPGERRGCLGCHESHPRAPVSVGGGVAVGPSVGVGVGRGEGVGVQSSKVEAAPAHGPPPRFRLRTTVPATAHRTRSSLTAPPFRPPGGRVVDRLIPG